MSNLKNQRIIVAEHEGETLFFLPNLKFQSPPQPTADPNSSEPYYDYVLNEARTAPAQ